MSSTTTYLITGANRGLGKGFVEAYLSRPNTVVIAAVRDTNSDQAKALSSLPVGDSSKLIVVKIDSKSQEDPKKAVDFLKTTHGITHLDVVIANAGVSVDYEPVETTSISDLQEHIAVNAIGPLTLFQAVFPLLKQTQNAKFVVIGSAMGSIGYMEQRAAFSMYGYGASKAMAHYTSRKIHFTHEDIISFVLDPGFVQTDMGNQGAQRFGMEKAYTEIDDCVVRMVAVVDAATREGTSGKYVTWDGSDFGF